MYGSCKDAPYGNVLKSCKGICLNVIQHDNVYEINRGLLYWLIKLKQNANSFIFVMAFSKTERKTPRSKVLSNNYH